MLHKPVGIRAAIDRRAAWAIAFKIREEPRRRREEDQGQARPPRGSISKRITMSNTGQLQSAGVQAFQKGANAGGSSSGLMMSMAFVAAGVGCAGVAVATAVTQAEGGGLAKVAEVLDKVGLDKGPLFLFGALFVGVGVAIARIGRGSGDANGQAISGALESLAGDMEGQGAILASLQGELSSLRATVVEARSEAQEARNEAKSSNGEASDPMFRLAASLDQLGARIDKRMDGARQEMLGAVQAVAARIEAVDSGITAGDDAAPEKIEELLVGLAELKNDVRELARHRQSDDRPVGLPYELTDEDRDEGASATDASGESSHSSANCDADDEHAVSNEGAAGETPAQGSQPPIAMTLVEPDGEFPEPPAPMPKPTEGLELIDEMNEDKARAADMTPPLFPEIDPSDFGG